MARFVRLAQLLQILQADFHPPESASLQSEGNVDEAAYVSNADWRVPLTERGREQATEAGQKLASLLEPGARLHTYVSPYARTRDTLRKILQELPDDCVVRLREDPRISEQQFGNFQDVEQVTAAKKERSTFGRFYYRFPNGESGLDVYMRVSSFVATLFRDHSFSGRRDTSAPAVAGTDAPVGSPAGSSTAKDWQKDNILIVTHGLTLRLLLMRYYQWSVRSFERTHNPGNAELIILERQRPKTAGSGMSSDATGVPPDAVPGHFSIVQDAGILRDLPQAQWRRDDKHGLQMRLTEPPPGAGPWPLNSA